MKEDKKNFPLPFLCMTFGVSPSENFFQSLKSASSDDKIILLELFFILYLAAKGGYAYNCYLPWKVNINPAPVGIDGKRRKGKRRRMK